MPLILQFDDVAALLIGEVTSSNEDAIATPDGCCRIPCLVL